MNEMGRPSALPLTPSDMAAAKPAFVLFNSQEHRQQGTGYTSLPKKEMLVPTSLRTKREKYFFFRSDDPSPAAVESQMTAGDFRALV